MLIKIYIMSSVLAFISFVLLLLRTSNLIIDDNTKNELNKNTKVDTGIKCLRIIIVCIAPILNIGIALYGFVLFVFYSDERLVDIINKSN